MELKTMQNIAEYCCKERFEAEVNLVKRAYANAPGRRQLGVNVVDASLHGEIVAATKS
jgi:hypothetical protein